MYGTAEVVLVTTRTYRRRRALLINIIEQTFTFKGFGEESTKARSAVLPGLSRADSDRPACSEGCFSHAGVHTIRVSLIPMS